MNTKRRTDWIYVTVLAIVWGLLGYTLAVSASHIVASAQKLGLDGWQSWTTPLLVDVIAIVGKLGRLDRFAEQTRRAAFKLMVFGGLLSLAANAYAGDNLGERGYGVLLVAVFLTLESFAAKLRRAPAAAKTGRRCDTGCTCGKHAPRKAAAKKPAARKPRAPKPAVTVDAIVNARGPVPTSPAPYGA